MSLDLSKKCHNKIFKNDLILELVYRIIGIEKEERGFYNALSRL